jgi:hypothetical protein
MISALHLKLDDFILIVVIILLIFLFILKYREGRLGDEAPKEIGVGSLIDKVRMELHKAEELRKAQQSDALFQIETFDLEVNFVIKSSETGDGGVKVEPVTIGGKSEIATEKIQKITLHMKAIGPQDYYENDVVESKTLEGKKVREYGQRPPSKQGGTK